MNIIVMAMSTLTLPNTTDISKRILKPSKYRNGKGKEAVGNAAVQDHAGNAAGAVRRRLENDSAPGRGAENGAETGRAEYVFKFP